MHVVALIMAGGRGERMRLSGVDLAKPLVPVLGTTLLERNLRALHRHGFEQVVVSVAAGDEEVLALAARLPVEALWSRPSRWATSAVRAGSVLARTRTGARGVRRQPHDDRPG